MNDNLFDTSDTSSITVLCSHPSFEKAKELANLIVKQNKAKCVNLIPNITSIYSWENKLQQESEVLMMIKTTKDNYKPLEQTILNEHPYDCPEIIALPIIAGFIGYLKWLNQK